MTRLSARLVQLAIAFAGAGAAITAAPRAAAAQQERTSARPGEEGAPPGEGARPAEEGESGPAPVDPDQATEAELPSGKWGFIGGLRQNVGELGGMYSFGWLWGLAAGYQPTRPGQSLSVGFDWSAMFGRFYASQVGIADDPLKVVEMSFGTRVRTAVGEESPRFLAGTAGLTVMRTSAPVPPGNDRLYVGGYVGFGVEQYLGSWLVGLEARFGLLGNGPSGLTLVGSVSWGSR